MKTYNVYFRYTIVLVTYIITVFFALSLYSMQDDTVKVNSVAAPPVIDGTGDDDCWENADWQTIDQVWINYGEAIDSKDFNGRYKLVWSSKENLLYFLVEVTDDVTIGGFVDGQPTGVYNYDIAEVFIDENKSGGLHINDNTTTGENAENAFAYHIYADFPTDGEVNKEHWVGDIPGPHTDHIPEFALRKNGNLCIREFSLKVYDDTYDDTIPEASRVILSIDKIMGLSVAYCDNDEDDGQRDNFFGSVWVKAENYNDHWMNADDFGLVKLYSSLLPDHIEKVQCLPSIEIYPNPASDYINFKTSNAVSKVEILDITGKVSPGFMFQGSECSEIQVSYLARGFYLTRIVDENNIFSFGKFIKY